MEFKGRDCGKDIGIFSREKGQKRASLLFYKTVTLQTSTLTPEFLQKCSRFTWQDMTNPFWEAHLQKSLEILTTLRMYGIF